LARGDPDADADALEQALQQFVNQSPWDPVPVRRRLAERMTAAIGPAAWVIDDTGFPKFGRHSVGVAPQYCGALGKVANCQVGVSLRQLVVAASAQAATTVTWREGADGEQLTSRFVALRVRPAGVKLRRATHGSQLAVRWLVAEWPAGEPEPVKDWLANLPETTPLEQLVGLAKLRWRVEHDYRELKDALGLDHFEGRSWQGWHHHVTLVSVAHAFVTLERLDPKARASA